MLSRVSLRTMVLLHCLAPGAPEHVPQVLEPASHLLVQPDPQTHEAKQDHGKKCISRPNYASPLASVDSINQDKRHSQTQPPGRLTTWYNSFSIISAAASGLAHGPTSRSFVLKLGPMAQVKTAHQLWWRTMWVKLGTAPMSSPSW
jgi:hypothetical protein